MAKSDIQEWIWDYPVQTEMLASNARIKVVWEGETMAETKRAFKCVEMGNAPVFLIPPNDVAMEWLRPTDNRTHSEWMGVASLWQINYNRKTLEKACLSMTETMGGYAKLTNYFAFHAGLTTCTIDGEPVKPQRKSKLYGWITPDIMGPFKGDPGHEDQVKLMSQMFKEKGISIGGG